MPKSSIEKAAELKDKIQKQRERLKKLKQKRLLEVGKIAAQYELHELKDTELHKLFKRLAKG